MDVDLMEHNSGSKRVHQRFSGHQQQSSNPGGGNRICNYFLQGRCTRRPCNFLHQNPPPQSHAQPSFSSDKRKLQWRNPNAPSKWGSRSMGHGGGAPETSSAAPSRNQARICKFFANGIACRYGDACWFLHAWSTGDDFSALTALEGHGKVITGIAFPSGSDKLYSGSKDGSVKVWDCQTGKCVADLALGQEVGCLLGEGSWIFVGVPNAVKAWNPQLGVDQSLNGPAGQVYALAVGNDFLFAGVQDGNILAWKVNAALHSFEPAASLSGHQRAVISLVFGGMRIYSGSMDHTIRVWDATNLQCLQSISDHHDVVMSLLCWDQFLLSCSLDRTIKVWVTTESGSLEVTYTHELEHGVLTLGGMQDSQGKPVLLCSCNDNTVYLYDLPSFAERGRIFSEEEVRAIETGPGGLFFTGNASGELKVWKVSS